MKLIADIGNTLSKFAVFNNAEIVDLKTFEGKNTEEQYAYLNNLNSIKGLIHATVGPEEINFRKLFPATNCLSLSFQTPLPIENLYESPESLGADRIALAVGGNNMFPEQNLLIIDLGTCITFDFVNIQGQYLGGSISPGVNLRFASLNNYTNKLPLISLGKNPLKKQLVASNTHDSIKTGVLTGILKEIEGIIASYIQEHKGLITIFTGGHYPVFEDAMQQSFESKKNQIFADPFLTLKGMNVILDYNENH